MSGLIDSTGLAFGSGLIWLEEGLGGPGLTIPDAALTVDFWQNFEGALTPEGLAANDHAEVELTWEVVNDDGRLSVGAPGEMGNGTFIDEIEDTGVQGLLVDCNAEFEAGNAVVGLASGYDAISTGFWFTVPVGIIGTFTEHDLIRIRDDQGDRNLIMKVFGDSNAINCAAFTPEENYSPTFTIPAATPLWATISFTRNVSPDGYKLRVYTPDGTLLGEATRISGNTQVLAMDLGTVIGANAFTGDLLFDDWVADWTDATFPLGPPVAA